MKTALQIGDNQRFTSTGELDIIANKNHYHIESSYPYPSTPQAATASQHLIGNIMLPKTYIPKMENKLTVYPSSTIQPCQSKHRLLFTMRAEA